MLGGQVICEIDGNGVWQKGYVYLGGQMLAIQQYGTVSFVHQDPITKSQRLTDTSGNVIANATIELDPWGGETSRTWNNRQSHVFTTYDRDAAGMDEAGARKYHGWWSRFDQPDPYDGSYNMADPQSFNRYAYVQNDPVNLSDPSGLDDEDEDVVRIYSYALADRNFGTVNVVDYYDPIGSGGFFFGIGWNIRPYPTVPAPDPNFGLGDPPPPQTQQTLNNSVARSQQRVNSHPDCAKLFHNLNPNVILESFKSSPISNDTAKFKGEGNAAVTTRTDAPLSGGITRFNQNSFFFSGTMGGKPLKFKPNSSNYGLSLNELRELVLLHEAYHRDDRYGGYDDENNPQRGVDLNFLIRSKCF